MIFKNIFAEKFSEKIGGGVFDSKQSKIMQNFDHNIGFCEKRQFFAENCRKSQKIVIITSTPGAPTSARRSSRASAARSRTWPSSRRNPDSSWPPPSKEIFSVSRDRKGQQRSSLFTKLANCKKLKPPFST
jgi:hypothetical protein